MTSADPTPASAAPGTTVPEVTPAPKPATASGAAATPSAAAVYDNDAIAPHARRGAHRGRARFSIRTFSSLRDPGYRWFFISLFSHFASMNMQMFIRGYLVFELTGSYAALGVMALANGVPQLGFSLFGGVIADRVAQKKYVVQLGQALAAVNAGVIGLLILGGSLRVEHLVIAALVQGVSNSLLMPSRQALTNEVVGGERLMNALALNNAAQNFARLMLPTAAGVLFALVNDGGGIGGAEYVYFLMTALYIVAMLAMARVPRSAPRPAIATPWRAVFRELAEGIDYIRRTPPVRRVLIVNFLVVMCSMPYFQMLPGFVSDVLDGGPSALGALMSVQGVGSLAGSLVIASLPPRNRGRLLLISALVLGVGLVLFSWSTWILVTAPILLIVGVGQAGRMSLSQVLVQTYTDDAHRGRVLSVYQIEMGLVQFGTFFVALLASVIGAQLAIGGTAIALLAIATYLLFVPSVRDME
ncbi:MAG: MFS transporter [Dehalococcoidia bacterium]